MKKVIFLLVTIITVMGCQSTNNRVTRVSTDLNTDLSGRWNDTDSRLVSEAMVEELLNGRVISNLRDEYNRKPTLIVGTIRNKSSEHINVSSFIKDMERELVNSGSFKVVASSDERLELRNEKEEQQSNATLETASRLAQETGADIMLIGTIITITDQLNNTKVVYYQVDLELIDLETTEKLWIGSKKHKKIIDLGGTKW